MKLNLLVGVAAAALLGFQVNAQTCTQTNPVTLLGLETNMNDGDTFSIEGDQIAQPAGTDVLVVDINYLDNSFNLKINGVLLASKQMQFQPNQTENVEFADHSQYGVGSVPQIYTLDGTGTMPKTRVLRLIIPTNGTTPTLLGSTTLGGPLNVLQFTDGTTFTSPTFNTGAQNTIESLQTVAGQTAIDAVSYWTTAQCATLATNEVNFKGFAYNSVVKGQLQLKSSNAIQDVKIYNMTGQLVRSAQPKSSNPTLNVQELQPGVYVMNVTINGTTKAYKVVKE